MFYLYCYWSMIFCIFRNFKSTENLGGSFNDTILNLRIGGGAEQDLFNETLGRRKLEPFQINSNRGQNQDGFDKYLLSRILLGRSKSRMVLQDRIWSGLMKIVFLGQSYNGANDYLFFRKAYLSGVNKVVISRIGLGRSK